MKILKAIQRIMKTPLQQPVPPKHKMITRRQLVSLRREISYRSGQTSVQHHRLKRVEERIAGCFGCEKLAFLPFGLYEEAMRKVRSHDAWVFINDDA